MKLGFYHSGSAPIYKLLAENLVDSVRRNMPGLEIVQFTDTETLPFDFVDSTSRLDPGPVPLRIIQAYLYASREDREWIFVDTDVVCRSDVRHVFDEPFDIAVASRDGTYKDQLEAESKFMRLNHQYNKGVVFSRSLSFWQDVEYAMLKLSEDKQWRTTSDQYAMNRVIESGNYDVKVLPSSYNYPPKTSEEKLAGKQMVHFKGHRKVWALTS